MSPLRGFNLALRALMELGIILAAGYWAYQTGNSAGTKILLAILIPVLVFGFWGLVDFRRAGSVAEPLRLIQELFISGLAAIALYVLGAKALGVILGLISIVHHILVYTTAQMLLKGDP